MPSQKHPWDLPSHPVPTGEPSLPFPKAAVLLHSGRVPEVACPRTSTFLVPADPAGAPQPISLFRFAANTLKERSLILHPQPLENIFPSGSPAPTQGCLPKLPMVSLLDPMASPLSSVHPTHWQLDQARHSLLLGALSSLGFQGADISLPPAMSSLSSVSFAGGGILLLPAQPTSFRVSSRAPGFKCPLYPSDSQTCVSSLGPSLSSTVLMGLALHQEV